MNNFNITRFKNVARWDLTINKSFYRNFAFVVSGTILAITLFGLFFRWILMTQGNPSDEFSTVGGTAMVIAYAIGIIMCVSAGCLLHNLRNKQGRISSLTLPATNLEKFLWHTLLMIVGMYVLCFASIVVWALGYFPHDDSLSQQQQQEQSYIGRIGKAIEPVFRAQGFDWKLDVGLVAGVGAKEIVASTMGVLYSGDESVADDTADDNTPKYANLYDKMTADGITPLIAFAYLTFVLLYFPCLATIAAVKSESGSWKWAAFTAVYTTALAWIVSALIYQIGRLFV